MKRFLAAILALLFCISAAGCSTVATRPGGFTNVQLLTVDPQLPLAWQTYQMWVGFSHTKQSSNSLTPI